MRPLPRLSHRCFAIRREIEMLSGLIGCQQLHFFPSLAAVCAGSSVAEGVLHQDSRLGLADSAVTRSRPLVAGPVFTSGLHPWLVPSFETSGASQVGWWVDSSCLPIPPTPAVQKGTQGTSLDCQAARLLLGSEGLAIQALGSIHWLFLT